MEQGWPLGPAQRCSASLRSQTLYLAWCFLLAQAPSQALVVPRTPHCPTRHRPLLSPVQAPPLPSWPCLSRSWGVAGGWQPCPGPTRGPAQAGQCASRCCPPGLGRSREDNGPSQLLLSPHEGASQAPAPPALVGGPPRPAGSSCRPRPRPQAHLLPGQPLSVLPTPDLLAYFPSLARHNPASLARRPPLQVGCPTVFPRGYPLRSGGGQRAGELFTGTVSHGWRVWASRQSLLVHLGTPNILTS